jgi:hypothetical protein
VNKLLPAPAPMLLSTAACTRSLWVNKRCQEAGTLPAMSALDREATTGVHGGARGTMGWGVEWEDTQNTGQNKKRSWAGGGVPVRQWFMAGEQSA